ncbi:hypothetical protein BD560DRAFT_443978, partial [Blakeslea trispora]
MNTLHLKLETNQPNWDKGETEYKEYLFKELNKKTDISESSISKNSRYGTLKEDNREKFSQKFKAMKPEKNWKVEDAYVENVLYEFGRQHGYKNASHSFILNAKDDLLAAKFSKDQWKAVLKHNSPELPLLPAKIDDELKAIKVEKHLNFVGDGSLRTMYTCLLMLLDVKQSSFFEEDNVEDDIKSNLWWPLLDYVGESSCVASAKRKMAQDVAAKRNSMERKADLRVISHVDRLELGYGEGSRVEDVDSFKNIYDSSMKTAKCLKDMLLCLLDKAKYHPDVVSHIFAIGFQFSSKQVGKTKAKDMVIGSLIALLFSVKYFNLSIFLRTEEPMPRRFSRTGTHHILCLRLANLAIVCPIGNFSRAKNRN